MRRKAHKLSRPVGRYYSDIWERHSMIDVISDIALKCLGIIAAAVVIVIGIGALGRNKCECITEEQSVDHEKRTPVTGREIATDPPVYHLPDSFINGSKVDGAEDLRPECSSDAEDACRQCPDKTETETEAACVVASDDQIILNEEESDTP